MDLPFHTLDVFTDRTFGGNPLGVFPDAAHLPTDLMQRIALEQNLSETVFLGPPETTGDARVRPIELTDRGRDLQATSEGIYKTLESRWAEAIGNDRLAALRADLISVTSTEDGELPPVRPLW